MIDIVIPTIGRDSLPILLASVAASSGPRPGKIIVVDDRRDATHPIDVGNLDADFCRRLTILRGHARGPAAARNLGWRSSQAKWIAFVDDDVVVEGQWLSALHADLDELPLHVAGSTGCITVPPPPDRLPTDWERNVASLETARWITADCAYRRSELAAVGGFDERFERAYREDADLALRIVARGREIARGARRAFHPVRPAPWDISIRLQAGNADDVLMDALHGAGWYDAAAAPRGAFRSHVATVSLAAVAALAGTAWFAATARFAWRRIASGPRDGSEIVTMLVSSVVIPFAAVYHRLQGYARRRALLADDRRAPHPIASAVLLDRDGTLIVDVPFNREPSLVVPMPGARVALDRLRDAGVPTAVVSNQSGIGLGLLDMNDVVAVNDRVEALLGPLGPVFVCPHAPHDACACRKPQPGLLVSAALQLGVPLSECVMIGDIGADIEAARAAGARSILVATAVTKSREISAAPFVVSDLESAIDAVLGGMA